MTCDIIIIFCHFFISTHTLTWSVTGCIGYFFLIITDFNSHAHVERDHIKIENFIYIIISTHTLTWSVTASKYREHHKVLISTHTLTWSVTVKS